MNPFQQQLDEAVERNQAERSSESHAHLTSVTRAYVDAFYDQMTTEYIERCQ